MEIKRLNSDIISKIRSSCNINSVAQCVFELVSNSLDAKSTSIAVRINLITFKIQVADNGEGITKENMELLGIRYMTNKCHKLGELEQHLSTYGFRGEVLASIVEICRSVSINSRCKNSSEAYNTTLAKELRSEVKLAKHRASVGTTVTVLGFLSNFPIRQQRVIQEIELEEVKKYMESLVIINPGTSFSLRNDVTGLLMLNSPKSIDIIDSFRHLHPDISDSFTLLKVSKNKLSIDALIHQDFIISKKFQYVYVNKRPVSSPKIIKYINSSFYKKMQLKTKRKKHPIYETRRYSVFVLNIKCPPSYVDLLMGPSKSEVEFKCWDLVLTCIEKIIKSFFGLDDKKETEVAFERKGGAMVSCGVSQVLGAVQACAYKRKNKETVVDGKDDFETSNNKDVTQKSVESSPVCVKKSKVNRMEEKKVHPKQKNTNVKPFQSFVKDKTAASSSQNAKLSGNYQIEDSGKQAPFLKPRKLKSIIKKPLPITVKPRTKGLKSKFIGESISQLDTMAKLDQSIKFDIAKSKMKDDTHLDVQLVPKCQFDQKSVYSRLNNDEDQGKNLIMDMFLKSTQVFTGEDGKSEIGKKPCPNLSGETIEESNFVMENNIHDTVRGINTTMSISVNVKKKKLRDCDRKVSKCVQTSLVENRLGKLTCKSVQTSQKPPLARPRSNLSDLAHQFDGFKLSHEINEDAKDNYTILINTVRKRREFRFVRKSEEMDVDSIEEEENFKPFKLCRCREDDGKLFKFDKENRRGPTAIPLLKENLFEKPYRQEMVRMTDKPINRQHDKEDSEAIFRKPSTRTIIEAKLTMGNQKCNNKIRRNNLHFRGITKERGPKIAQNIDAVERSPYFGKTSVQNQALDTSKFISKNLEQSDNIIAPSYIDFQPKFKSTQIRQNRMQTTYFASDLNKAQNNIVSSPYFVGNCRQNGDLPSENNVCLADVIGNQVQNVNNKLQNCLCNFPAHHYNLLYQNEHCGLKYHDLQQSCLKPHNMVNNNQLIHQNLCDMELHNNYGKDPNANVLPRCDENVFRFNRGISHQYFKLLKDSANNFERQGCCKRSSSHYKEDICYNNHGNLNLRSRAENICCQNCHEPINLARNTQNYVSGVEHNLQSHDNNLYIHKNITVDPDHNSLENLNFDEDQGQPMEQNEQNFALYEEAPWYTPNVSDENMYFERTLSEPDGEVTYNKKVGDVQKLCTKQNTGNSDMQMVAEDKQKFNFKFSCTPDIFSDDVVCKTQNKPDLNNKPVENNISNKANDFFGAANPDDFEKLAKKDFSTDFNNFFDLATFGVVESKDAYKTTNTFYPSKEESNLEITILDDQEKHNIIEEELKDAGKNNTNRFFSANSKVKIVEEKTNEEKCDEKSRIIVDSQNEWVRKYNEAGKRFYVNERTGMVTTATPKTDQALFSFDKRLDFVPKGMSPVLKEHKKIDRSLSQNAKTKLHDFILESYENELMVIKWQHYISDDPKAFFEEIYKEKSKQFENEIPSIQDSAIKNRVKSDLVDFNRKLFKTIEVIGQVDKKFIAVLEKIRKLVVLFDQHAVHERIRVEQFLREYKGLKTPCKEQLTFFMPRNDLSLLKNHSAYLSSVGLDVEYFTNGLKILSIPGCLQEKFNSQDNSEDLSKIVNMLIKDIIESLKITRGSTTQLPRIVQNIINLKACRGAIKFGDSLTKEECVRLLNDLAKCNLPFQCAHGRPTITPVLTLAKIEFQEKRNKLNLKKLLCCT